MDAGLELGMNLIRRRAFFAKMIDLALELGVAVDYLAVSNKELQ